MISSCTLLHTEHSLISSEFGAVGVKFRVEDFGDDKGFRVCFDFFFSDLQSDTTGMNLAFLLSS